MIRGWIALTFLSLLFLLTAVLLGRFATAQPRAQLAEVTREYRLTAPALFTEARYTRHPAETDMFSPFQDSPGSLEHFPSGSFLPLPERGNR